MKRLLDFTRQNPIVAIFIVLFTASNLIVRGFFSANNFINILTQQSYLGVACICATFLMIGGSRDLSIGMMMGLSSCLAVGLMPAIGLLSIPAAMLACLAIGYVNGFFVGKFGLHSFIVTLATMQGTRSFTYIYTKEQSLNTVTEPFTRFAQSRFLGLPSIVWIFLFSVVVSELVLRFTTHGRNTYAVGGNIEAAFNAGINVAGVTIVNFMISAFGGALGGIISAMRISGAIPELGFPNLHFMVLVMVVLGGTKLSGGYGRPLYTLCGVLTLGVIQNVLNLMNVHAYYEALITGLLMIGVLYMDRVMTESELNRLETQSRMGQSQ